LFSIAKINYYNRKNKKIRIFLYLINQLNKLMAEPRAEHQAAQIERFRSELNAGDDELNQLYPRLNDVVGMIDGQIKTVQVPKTGEVVTDIMARIKHILARIHQVMARVASQPSSVTEADIIIGVTPPQILAPLPVNADRVTRLQRELDENDQEINHIYKSLEAIVDKLKKYLSDPKIFNEDVSRYDSIPDITDRLIALTNSIIGKMIFMEGQANQEQGEQARQTAEATIKSGSIEAILQLPGLEPAQDWLQKYGNEAQHSFHQYTVGEHVRKVLDESRRQSMSTTTILAAALHDVGKQGAKESRRQKKDPENRNREPQHAENSTRLVRQMLNGVDWLTDQEKIRVIKLVQYHEYLGNIALYKNNQTKKRSEVYHGKSFDQYVQELADAVDDPSLIDELFRLTAADISGIKDNLYTASTKRLLRAAQSEVLQKYYQKKMDSVPNRTSAEYKQAQAEVEFNQQVARIKRRESLVDNDRSTFKYPTPTHRCSVQAALGILSSKGIISFANRGVNFKIAGLGADYGFITFIARGKESEVLYPNATMPTNGGAPWSTIYKHPYNVHTLSGVGGKSKAEDLQRHYKYAIDAGMSSEELSYEVANKSGNWHSQAEIAPCNAAQYNVGVRDEEKTYYHDRIDYACHNLGRGSNEVTAFVPSECLTAMMIPSFLVGDPVYQQLLNSAQQNGIEVIISPTGTALDYLGESLAYFLNPDSFSDRAFETLDSIGPYVAKSLSEHFKIQITYNPDKSSIQYQTFKSYLKKYLQSTGAVSSSANDENVAMNTLNENYQKGLNRGMWYAGNYLNTVGEQSYIQEQDIYYTYMARKEREASLAKAA
jgi:HD domain-containing protein